MPQRQLDLLDVEPGADRVEGHPHLAPEAGRSREAALASPGRERALAGERLTEIPAGRKPEQPARGALGEPEAAALALRERGDGYVGVRVRERPQVAREVCVAEQDRPGQRIALGERERLALP